VIVERHGDIARQARAETIEITFIAGGIDRRIGPAVEGTLETDDVDALFLALEGMVLACQFQRALDRFGARIGEENLIGERGSSCC